MDALLVDGDEIELTPDPPWMWMAPVRLSVTALPGHLTVTDDENGWPIGGGLDGTVTDWLNFKEDGKALRNDLRTRFTAHAEILLFLCKGGLGTGVSLAQDLADALNVRVLGYTEEIGLYLDLVSGKVDRNLTSIGLVPDGEFDAAKGTRIKPGYPFTVDATSTRREALPIPDGSHVRPDRIFPKPKKPVE